MAQLVGALSLNQKVAGSIPSQGTCLGAGLIPSLGTYGRQPIDVCLSHQCFSLSLPLFLEAMKKMSSGEDILKNCEKTTKQNKKNYCVENPFKLVYLPSSQDFPGFL